MGGINDFMDNMSSFSHVPRLSVPDEVCQRLSGPSQIRDSDSAQSTNFMAMIELSHRWIESSFLPADIPIGPVPDPLGITLYHFMKVSKRCFVAVILIFVDLFNLVIIFIHVSI